MTSPLRCLLSSAVSVSTPTFAALVNQLIFVKNLFVILAFLFFLAASFCGEAKALDEGDDENVEHTVAPVLRKKQAADFSRPIQVRHLSFKIRDQRIFPGSLKNDWFAWQPSSGGCMMARGIQSCFHLPFLRLLLFPNHYFW